MSVGKRALEWGRRTYIMGILNLTPDSFSEGGVNFEPAAAIATARRMLAEGAAKGGDKSMVLPGISRKDVQESGQNLSFSAASASPREPSESIKILVLQF